MGGHTCELYNSARIEKSMWEINKAEFNIWQKNMTWICFPIIHLFKVINQTGVGRGN